MKLLKHQKLKNSQFKIGASIIFVVGASIGAYLLWPQSPVQPESQSVDVLTALLEGRRLPSNSIATAQGKWLSRSELDGLEDRIIRPLLNGLVIQSTGKDAMASSARYSALLRAPDGSHRYFSVISARAPEGAFVPLGILMGAVYSLEERRTGYMSVKRFRAAELCISHIKNDRAIFDSLGLTGMKGDNGEFKNWDDLISYYTAVSNQKDD